MKMSFTKHRIGTLIIYHYLEIEDEKGEVLSGIRTRDLALQMAGHDDLWLHLQATLLASVFRHLQRPGNVAK